MRTSSVILALTVFAILAVVQANATILSGEAIFKHPFYSEPRISPDGKYVVGRRYDGEKRELIITDTKSGKHYLLVFFAKRNYLKDVYWIDNDSIYIEYVSGKDHRKSIVNINYDELGQKSSAERIKTEGYLLNPLPETEDEVLFVRQMKDAPLKVYQISTNDLIKGNFSHAKSFKSNKNDALLYFYNDQWQQYFSVTVDDDNENAKLWFLSEESNDWMLLYESSNNRYHFKPIQYLGQNRFLVLTNRTTDNIAVAIFNVDKQDVEDIIYEHPIYDIQDANFDVITNSLLSVTYTEHGNPHVEYFSEQEAQVASFYTESEDDDPVYPVATSLDGSKSILLAYGATHPGSYIIFDEKTKQTRLLEHRFPDLIGHEFAKTRKVSVPGADSVEAYLTLPYLGGNGTLIVMLYPNTGKLNSLTEFSKSVQFLANRGYAILRLGYRPAIYIDADDHENTQVSINVEAEHDINKIVTFISDEYQYDKACTLGMGYGGYSTIKLPQLYPDDYDCAVSLFGIYDFQLLFSASNATELKLNQQKARNIVEENKEALVNQSPVYLAGKMDLPLLFIAGHKDRFAVPEQLNRLRYTLDKHDNDAQYLIFSKLGHGPDTWYQEQQIHALIDDFIRRKLALPALEELGDPPEAAKEYVKIADVYDYDTLLENQKMQSFEYYVRAARLEHPRSMFNYGSYFHRGEFVDYNLHKAISWYKKASKADYSPASYRLGILFNKYPQLTEDKTLAHQYFLAAFNQGFDARAGLKLAEQYCTGEIVEKDVIRCLALLDLDKIKFENLKNKSKKVTDDSYKLRNKLLPKLLIAIEGNSELQAFYNDILETHHHVSNEPLQFEVVKEGIFSNEGADGHQRTTYSVPMKQGVNFGVSFRVTNAEEKGTKRAVVVRFLRSNDKAQNVPIWHYLFKSSSDKEWFVYHTLAEDELEPSVYTLQIFNLNGELLYSQDYHVRG